MPPPVVICLVIDGWHIGYWGAYGNTHVATPEADRWAAAGLLMDQCLVNATDLAGAYRALWRGQGALVPADTVDSDAVESLAKRFASAGYRTLLVTDETAVLSLSGAGDFVEQRVVAADDHPSAQESAADSVEETELFRFFSTLGDALESAADSGTPTFIWAHCRGFFGPWDAPYELRVELTEEGDPPPPQQVRFEHRLVAEDIDPDELLGLRTAYAAQIRVLDLCLGALDDLLEELGLADRATVVLTSSRGFPLGEHRRIGLVDHALHEELAHVPLVVRFAADSPAETRASSEESLSAFATIARRPWATVRSQRLVQHSDLPALLLEHFHIAGDSRQAPSFLAGLGAASTSPAGNWRDHLCLRSATDMAIRTAAWHLRQEIAGDATPQLFVKPDDRWEVNDVASRCGAVVEGLQAALARAQTRGDGVPAASQPLDAVLREGLG